MVSRDSLVTVGSAVLALFVTSVSVIYTSVPPWANLAMLVLVGVVAPRLVNGYLDSIAVDTAESGTR